MQAFVYGETVGTLSASSGTLEDILTLDLPGDPLNPQDWVLICSGEAKVYNGAATTDIRSDVRITLNGTDQYLYQYKHQNGVSINSRTGYMGVLYLKDHAGFLTGGVHQTYSTLKVRATHNTTDSATGAIDATNTRILGIRIPKRAVGVQHYFTKSSATAFSGTGSAIYGETSFAPTRGRYLFISTVQLTLAANGAPGTVDFKMVVAETKDAASELGATTQELRRVPHVDLDTAAAGTGHITHQEDAAVAQKVLVSAFAVVDVWDTPTSCSWLVDHAGTSASTQAEHCKTVAIPLDGNFDYAFRDYAGSRTNATATYAAPLAGFSFGRTGKKTFLLYEAFATKTAAGDLDAAVFPGGTTTGAYGSIFAQTLPVALETLYLLGSAMFTGVVSAGVDIAFRENTASGGDALLNNCCLLALTDSQSGQSAVQVNLDLPMPYDVEAYENTNIVDSATDTAIKVVANSAEPLGTQIIPVVRATDTRTTAISMNDTVLTF